MINTLVRMLGVHGSRFCFSVFHAEIEGQPSHPNASLAFARERLNGLHSGTLVHHKDKVTQNERWRHGGRSHPEARPSLLPENQACDMWNHSSDTHSTGACAKFFRSFNEGARSSFTSAWKFDTAHATLFHISWTCEENASLS